MTGGVAVGDYDNDGWDDVFFTVFYGNSLLYRNNGMYSRIQKFPSRIFAIDYLVFFLYLEPGDATF